MPRTQPDLAISQSPAGAPGGVESSRPLLAGLVEQARARARPTPPNVALVYPCDGLALAAAKSIRSAAIARPLLVGPVELLARAADVAGIALGEFEIVETPADPASAARAAAALARQGIARALMKGSLHTDELMSAVVRRDSGLRTETRMSHVALFEMPRYPKLLGLTDCGLNIAPDLPTKRDIVSNSLRLLRSLGIAQPKVAAVAAVETVNPAIQATVDAASLAEMGRAGYWGNAVVEGPLGFDNAVCATAARIKQIESRVSGEVDLLVVPDLNAGNVLYKSLGYMADGDCAAIVLGARVPLVLTSRADSMTSRLASMALALLSCEPEAQRPQ